MEQQIKDLIQRVDALERELAFLFYPPFQLFPSGSRATQVTRYSSVYRSEGGDITLLHYEMNSIYPVLYRN